MCADQPVRIRYSLSGVEMSCGHICWLWTVSTGDDDFMLIPTPGTILPETPEAGLAVAMSEWEKMLRGEDSKISHVVSLRKRRRQ